MPVVKNQNVLETGISAMKGPFREMSVSDTGVSAQKIAVKNSNFLAKRRCCHSEPNWNIHITREGPLTAKMPVSSPFWFLSTDISKINFIWYERFVFEEYGQSGPPIRWIWPFWVKRPFRVKRRLRRSCWRLWGSNRCGCGLAGRVQPARIQTGYDNAKMIEKRNQRTVGTNFSSAGFGSSAPPPVFSAL